jgi:YD repeat-containing protein
MIKRIVPMFFLFGIYQCLSGAPVYGQSGNCTTTWYCGWYSFSSGCIPTPPQGAYNATNAGGPWSFAYTYVTTTCAPVAAKDECQCADASGGGGGGGGGEADSSGGDSGAGNGGGGGRLAGGGGGAISLVTGNTSIVQTDVRIPGLANGLTLSRTWNSKWPPTQILLQTGLFGFGWRSNYEERVFTGSDNYIKYSRGDGSFWSFAYAGAAYAPVAPGHATATFILPNNNSTTCTPSTLTLQNGEKRIFDCLSGFLTAIVDRNGNTTQLSYDSINRLTTVTDPAGRHLYFGYGSNSSYLVTSVTSDVGLSLTYTYDSSRRLVQVTKPDQTYVTFQYDSNSRITTIQDSAGKVIESHTYDSRGRGLTSSWAAGADAITVTYDNPFNP